MYNLDFSYKSLEQRQEEKRKEEFKEEKIIQDLKFDEIDSKQALEIFNPLNNLNNPDVPEITYEGYLMGNHRIFIARNFIDKSDIEYCKHMFKFMEHRKQYYREENIIQENYDDKGAFLDNWVSKGFPFAPFSESLLLMYHKRVEKLFGLRLVPTYSYGRTYERHSRLLSHSDRPSCEFSATLPISFDTDDGKPWVIWARGDHNFTGLTGRTAWDLSMGKPFYARHEKAVPVALWPGDVLFYQGSNVIHWRERLVGNSARQVFLHYLHVDGPMYRDFPKLKYDSRPSIYHGTGSLNAEARHDASRFLQDIDNYKYYANVSITDPATGKACGKGFEKFKEGTDSTF